MKVVALAGGVGGAKLADGLAQVLPPEDLTVIVNTGDDFEHWGLWISPDLDTVCYTLAGNANSVTGWGLESESWQVFQSIQKLGGENWFRIGDRDLATHLMRTYLMKQGQQLSEITRFFCQAWGVQCRIIPMTDQRVSTIVITQDGQELEFQEYFVHRQCQPAVKGFRFEGIGQATPVAGALELIESADLIVICPSNPWVSIQPILSVNGIQSAIIKKPVVAVSPIIGGQAVKGPAAKMYTELGMQPSSVAVCENYQGLIQGLVIDNQDAHQVPQIHGWGIMTLVTDSLMRDRSDRARLAKEVLEFASTLT